MGAETFVLNPLVVRTRRSDDGEELWNLETGERTLVGLDVVSVLAHFESPRGFLIPHHYLPQMVPDPRRGFANLPQVSLAPFFRMTPAPDVGFLGVPYDSGVLTAPGARFGPDM